MIGLNENLQLPHCLYSFCSIYAYQWRSGQVYEIVCKKGRGIRPVLLGFLIYICDIMTSFIMADVFMQIGRLFKARLQTNEVVKSFVSFGYIGKLYAIRRHASSFLLIYKISLCVGLMYCFLFLKASRTWCPGVKEIFLQLGVTRSWCQLDMILSFATVPWKRAALLPFIFASQIK